MIDFILHLPIYNIIVFVMTASKIVNLIDALRR